MQPTIPVRNFVSDGDTLFQWMGSLWTTLYSDPTFLRRLQHGRALGAAQTYLDLMEVAGLLDRKAAPVFHRERWYPLVIRKSQQGQGDAAALTLNMEPTPVLGPQTDPAFPPRTVFQLGSNAAFSQIVTYPLATTPARVVTCLVDNLVAPNVLLIKDRDFVIQDGTVVLYKKNDPFGEDSSFPTTVVTTDTVTDQETVLWACDVLFDRDYVYDHIGYVFGVRMRSTDYFKTLLNSIWDITTSGASPRLFSAALCALCNVPTVLTATETVETLTTDPNGDQLVITDKQVYRISASAALRTGVVPGAVLGYGDYLDQTIKIYAAICDPRPTKLAGIIEYAADIRHDVPVISLPPAFFKTPLTYGLSFSWEAVPIYCSGADANGNPKLWFPIEGLATDVTAFWEDVWIRCETQGVSLEACFDGYLDDRVPYQAMEGTCGHIEPLAFMLKNLIGANTVIVTLDVSQLRTGARKQLVPLFVDLLQGTLPAYVHLCFVERRTTPVEPYEVGDNVRNGVTYTGATSSTISARYYSLSRTSSGQVGGPHPARLTYKDRPPRIRWIPICKDQL